MANQWLRLWHDMPNDPKWRVIAKISKQRIGDVMAVYDHMLVCASTACDRGCLDAWCDEDVAAALDLETEDVAAIRGAMQNRVLDGDRLSGWEKRQPKREDGSADRSRDRREKQKQEEEQNRPQPTAADRNRPTDKEKEEDKDKDKDTNNNNQTRASAPDSNEATSRSLELLSSQVGTKPVLPLPSRANTEGFDEFCTAADAVGMVFDRSPGGVCDRAFSRFDMQSKRKAIDTICARLDSGEYADPNFVPRGENYLGKRKFDEPDRPRNQPSRVNSYQAANQECFYEVPEL